MLLNIWQYSLIPFLYLSCLRFSSLPRKLITPEMVLYKIREMTLIHSIVTFIIHINMNFTLIMLLSPFNTNYLPETSVIINIKSLLFTSVEDRVILLLK